MREISASDASRRFSAVLDAAENGETILVTRGGRRIAMITPASAVNGPAVLAVLDRWNGRIAVDEAFAANVAAAGSASTELDGDPWRD